MATIKYVFGILFTICKWGFSIFGMKNTQEMQDARKRQQEEILKKKVNDAIEKGDTKEVQNGLSE